MRSDADVTDRVDLFVNGTLMRGEELHVNLGRAHFVREARTAPRYRMYSIGDVHPGMLPADGDGVSLEGELYRLDLEQLEALIAGEPAGLGVGVVELQDGERKLGIVWAAAELPDTAADISRFGGWRAYRASTTATGR
jgi:AGZA family xanthine/uracil permease-like MFS transporter